MTINKYTTLQINNTIEKSGQRIIILFEEEELLNKHYGKSSMSLNTQNFVKPEYFGIQQIQLNKCVQAKQLKSPESQYTEFCQSSRFLSKNSVAPSADHDRNQLNEQQKLRVKTQLTKNKQNLKTIEKKHNKRSERQLISDFVLNSKRTIERETKQKVLQDIEKQSQVTVHVCRQFCALEEVNLAGLLVQDERFQQTLKQIQHKTAQTHKNYLVYNEPYRGADRMNQMFLSKIVRLQKMLTKQLVVLTDQLKAILPEFEPELVPYETEEPEVRKLFDDLQSRSVNCFSSLLVKMCVGGYQTVSFGFVEFLNFCEKFDSLYKGDGEFVEQKFVVDDGIFTIGGVMIDLEGGAVCVVGGEEKVCGGGNEDYQGKIDEKESGLGVNQLDLGQNQVADGLLLSVGGEVNASSQPVDLEGNGQDLEGQGQQIVISKNAQLNDQIPDNLQTIKRQKAQLPKENQDIEIDDDEVNRILGKIELGEEKLE